MAEDLLRIVNQDFQTTSNICSALPYLEYEVPHTGTDLGKPLLQ